MDILKTVVLVLIAGLFSSFSILFPSVVSAAPGASVADLQMFWTLDIDENGLAIVSLNMTSWTLDAFNLSVPVTALGSVRFEGEIRSARQIETRDSFDYVEITPKGETSSKMLITFAWPDCAVAWNNSYYISANELLEVYPRGFNAVSNVTMILPKFSSIKSGNFSRDVVRTSNNRTIFSYAERGYGTTDQASYLRLLVYTLPYYEERMKESESSHIRLIYPTELSRWANLFLDNSENGYERISVYMKTRERGEQLKIRLVPSSYIEDRFWVGVLAFYERSEDTVYFPAHWSFAVSYGEPALFTLFHEIAHSFTPNHGLPKFYREGLADYLSFYALQSMGMREHTERLMNSYARDPLRDSRFNSTEFFNWDFENLRYEFAFEIVYRLTNRTDLSIHREFFNLLGNEQVQFNIIKDQQDRYNLFIYYLRTVSQKDIASFFSEYGLYANPDTVDSQLNFYLLFFIFDICLISMITLETLISLRHHERKYFAWSLTIITAGFFLSLMFSFVPLILKQFLFVPEWLTLNIVVSVFLFSSTMILSFAKLKRGHKEPLSRIILAFYRNAN